MRPIFASKCKNYAIVCDKRVKHQPFFSNFASQKPALIPLAFRNRTIESSTNICPTNTVSKRIDFRRSNKHTEREKRENITVSLSHASMYTFAHPRCSKSDTRWSISRHPTSLRI